MKSIYGIFSKILRKLGPLDSNHFIWISYIDICRKNRLDEQVKYANKCRKFHISISAVKITLMKR